MNNIQCIARIIIVYDKGIDLRQVELIDNSVIFNTSMFSGFDYPFTSFMLPLQEIRTRPVNNNINVIIDVLRNVSNILSPTQME